MESMKHIVGGVEILEITSAERIINSVEEGSDLLANVYYQGYDKVVIYEHQLRNDFFDLKNGFAGEVLQKFSNFRVRLVVLGDFENVQRKSLAHFVLESNKGKQVNFLATLPEALDALSQ